jgi:uncharacterized protein (TIGR03000 family)
LDELILPRLSDEQKVMFDEADSYINAADDARARVSLDTQPSERPDRWLLDRAVSRLSGLCRDVPGYLPAYARLGTAYEMLGQRALAYNAYSTYFSGYKAHGQAPSDQGLILRRMLGCEPDYRRDRRGVFVQLEREGDQAYQSGDAATAEQKYARARQFADGEGDSREIQNRLTRLRQQPPAVGETASPKAAVLTVRVPSTADLQLDGIQFAGTGEERRIETPGLKPGKPYQVTLRATWEDQGRAVSREKAVTVYAGQALEVDLRSP